MRGAAVPVRLAYVVGTYPVPTTTFIDREIRQLRELGAQVRTISIRRPAPSPAPGQSGPHDGVTYVLPASVLGLLRSHVTWLGTRPATYLGTLASLVREPHPGLAARLRTVGHFGLGVHVARLIRAHGPVDHVHAHFVDRAAVVALVAGRLLGRPYSATAHANDIYVDPVLLPAKLARAKFVATCTKYNERHLLSVNGTGRGAIVRCIYHGLDLHRYEPGTTTKRARPLLLSVAQLKEKKGLRFLLEACSLLAARGVAFDCEIVGDGPLHADLQRRVDELGLGDRVRLLGALPHDQVIARYAEAAVFVLPCVIASDGDRDGIPNVILEAMAMGLPVVSTLHSGIPEAVKDATTGLLVAPGDAEALAGALGSILADPDLGARMGSAGRERATSTFDVEVNVQRLLEEFVA